MTWRQLLNWGRGALDAEEAEWESWLLFQEVFQIERGEFLLKERQEALPAQEARYRALIKRRQKKEPVAYILGSWEFMGLPFKVTPAVLIPRQDTETLVEAALAWAPPKAEILDLCTGSGCIAISLAHYLPEAQVEALDISASALAVAQNNAKQNGVRIQFWQGDLWEPLPAGRQYDLITANPPYIDQSQLKELEADVREFEPRLALDGGDDGLMFYRRLASGMAAFLREGGRAFWEIGYDQAEAVTEIARQSGFKVLEVRKDLAGHDRVVILERE